MAGTDDVYAAGDVADFPVKQGGLATQQADAAAEAIAARLASAREPAAFRPVRRAVLLTGIRAALGGSLVGVLVLQAIVSRLRSTVRLR